MEKWDKPIIEEIDITATQYGASTVTEPDDIFVNADGNWEGTFVES